jgi:hypothetical protein
MLLDRLIASIEAKGPGGIKKADLRREFQETELDSTLEELLRKQEIFVEKKGTSFYCWHKKYYLQNLLNNDQKFSLIYSSINSLENSVASKFESANAKMELLIERVSTLDHQIRNLSEFDDIKISAREPPQKEEQTVTTKQVDFDMFKAQLDNAITNNSSSIGWVELSELRKVLCSELGISQEEFYQSIQQVLFNHYDKYELSSGGKEGIQLRGLIHGFVRCI